MEAWCTPSPRLPGPAQREGACPPAEHTRATAFLAKVNVVSPV